MITLTWLVYWIRTARSVFTGAGLKWLNIMGWYTNKTFIEEIDTIDGLFLEIEKIFDKYTHQGTCLSFSGEGNGIWLAARLCTQGHPCQEQFDASATRAICQREHSSSFQWLARHSCRKYAQYSMVWSLQRTDARRRHTPKFKWTFEITLKIEANEDNFLTASGWPFHFLNTKKSAEWEKVKPGYNGRGIVLHFRPSNEQGCLLFIVHLFIVHFPPRGLFSLISILMNVLQFFLRDDSE